MIWLLENRLQVIHINELKIIDASNARYPVPTTKFRALVSEFEGVRSDGIKVIAIVTEIKD